MRSVIKNWIIVQCRQRRPVNNPEIFTYLENEFHINDQTEDIFAELAQRIHNALFASIYCIPLTRTN